MKCDECGCEFDPADLDQVRFHANGHKPIVASGITGMRLFPIQTETPAKDWPLQRDSIPWKVIEPHEAQAKINHGGQSLDRLAQRQGLSACEAVAVLENKSFDVRWPRPKDGDWKAHTLEAIRRLNELCAKAKLK